MTLAADIRAPLRVTCNTSGVPVTTGQYLALKSEKVLHSASISRVEQWVVKG